MVDAPPSDTSPERLPDTGDAPAYVDTKLGIVTGAGTWFHVTEADLQTYAGEVLDHVPIPDLLSLAETWLDSARTVTLWAVPVLLWVLPEAWAAVAGAALYVVWRLFSPSFAFDRVARALSFVQHPVVQGLYYVAALSVFSGREQFLAVGIGLAFFVLLRWGVFAAATAPVLRPLWRQLYTLPRADQVLRGLVIRIALRHRLELSHIDAVAANVMDRWSTRRPDEAGSDATGDLPPDETRGDATADGDAANGTADAPGGPRSP